MLRLWDYKCDCGKVYRDHPVTGEKIPKTIACECGKRAGWTRVKKNQIHRSLSSQYGKLDPRFGQKVDSYEEKNRLLRERGLEETDVERFDDIQNEVAERQAKEAGRGKADYLVADSLEEITEQIKTDQVD